MSQRTEIINAVLERARVSGKKVLGFTRDYGSCEPIPKGGVPKHWDFIVCEGDLVWTRLPRDTGDGEAKKPSSS